MPSLKSLITGTAVLSLVNISRLLIQFFTLPILARLLNPTDYGVMAMAMPIVLFVMFFADIGLTSSLVRDKSAGPLAWHSCFWLTVLLGAAVTLILTILSPLAAWYMAEPKLGPIMATLSSVIVLQSLSLVPAAKIQSEGRFGHAALTDGVALVFSTAAVILLARHGYGVWSLVHQQVIFYAVRLVLNHVLSPYRPEFVFKWAEAKSHVAFGWNLLLINIVGLGSRSAENALVGKYQGASQLGVYGMAFQFARLPSMIVTGPLQYVLYPVISKSLDDEGKVRAQALLISSVLAVLIVPPMAMVAAASVPFFETLLSPKWSEVSTVFLLVAPAASLQPVIGILGTFVQAKGRPDVQLRLSVEYALVWLAALIASCAFGLETIAVAYAVVTVGFAFRSVAVSLPIVGCGYGEYIRSIRMPILSSIAAAVFFRLVVQPWSGSPLESLLLAAALMVAVMILCVGLEYRTAKRRFLEIAGRLGPGVAVAA